MSQPRGASPAPPAFDRIAAAEPAGYTVVARRYRPQRFEDVVGQDHVVQALRNAVKLNRVTHAYLFCGTRGVGKTSIARIFAKCLNCQRGPTVDPDQTCDICQAIAVGQDVDVIEIDGASNNGVEQVRELRQNAGLRPSRARFKIYYIDEVHMLSTGAFNALLKTLEEPPEHVKFFFATTEPNKIPVTVLSRCQRYDFAGITPDQIVSTLAEICDREAIRADRDALAVIARRAGGSMRDAQSLLEQLLSFGGETLTVELVQQQLGIASDDRTLDLLDALSNRDAATALGIVEASSREGVQPSEMLASAIDFLRDATMVAAKADVVPLAATPRQKPRLKAIADRWPIETMLAALQIMAEARGKLRGSSHGRTLVEIALLRVSMLDNLQDLGELVGRLMAIESGAPPVASLEKKKPLTPAEADRPVPKVPPAPIPAPAIRPSTAAPPRPVPPPWRIDAIAEAWPSWVASTSPEVASKLGFLRPAEIVEPSTLVLEATGGQVYIIDACDRPEFRVKIESSLRDWLDRPLILSFRRPTPPSAQAGPSRAAPAPRDDSLSDDVLIKSIVELLDARQVKIEREES